MFFLYAEPELNREIGYGKDLQLIAVSPISPKQLLAYRIILGHARIVLFSLLLILFPIFR